MEGKAPDKETQKIFLKTQDAIVGLNACIGMTIGDAYKDQSELVEDERYTNAESQTVFNEEVSCISRDIAMDQVIHSLLSKLGDYINFELPAIQKQSKLQQEKRLAVTDTINDLQDLKNGDNSSILLREQRFQAYYPSYRQKTKRPKKLRIFLRKLSKPFLRDLLGID